MWEYEVVYVDYIPRVWVTRTLSRYGTERYVVQCSDCGFLNEWASNANAQGDRERHQNRH